MEELGAALQHDADSDDESVEFNDGDGDLDEEAAAAAADMRPTRVTSAATAMAASVPGALDDIDEDLVQHTR
jgi:hypothetical protein